MTATEQAWTDVAALVATELSQRLKIDCTMKRLLSKHMSQESQTLQNDTMSLLKEREQEAVAEMIASPMLKEGAEKYVLEHVSFNAAQRVPGTLQMVGTVHGRPCAVKIRSHIDEAELSFLRRISKNYAADTTHYEINGVKLACGELGMCSLGYMLFHSAWTGFHDSSSVTLRAMNDILEAVVVAHQKDVIIVDLSVHNIIAYWDPVIGIKFKLNDLSQARDADNPHEVFEFTKEYTAPELFIHGECATFASDMYAVGVILFELLMRRPAWSGDFTKSAIPALVMKGKRPKLDLSQFADHFKAIVSDAIGTAEMGCFAQDPDNRPTAMEVLRIIENLSEKYSICLYT